MQALEMLELAQAWGYVASLSGPCSCRRRAGAVEKSLTVGVVLRQVSGSSLFRASSTPKRRQTSRELHPTTQRHNHQLRTSLRAWPLNITRNDLLTLQRTMSSIPPQFWGGPIRYCRWAAREKPALFWSVVIGGFGPVAVAPVRWLRFKLGDDTPPQIPQTYPGTPTQS